MQVSSEEPSSGDERRRMTRGQAAAAGGEYRHAVLRDELDDRWQDELEEDDDGGDGDGGAGGRGAQRSKTSRHVVRCLQCSRNWHMHSLVSNGSAMTAHLSLAVYSPALHAAIAAIVILMTASIPRQNYAGPIVMLSVLQAPWCRCPSWCA